MREELSRGQSSVRAYKAGSMHRNQQGEMVRIGRDELNHSDGLPGVVLLLNPRLRLVSMCRLTRVAHECFDSRTGILASEAKAREVLSTQK